jgi:Sulfotransferase family
MQLERRTVRPRQLRHAAGDITQPLAKNAAHGVAHSHAMMVFGGDAIYSIIPKNACSTLRLSIALANGAISHPREWKWIHKNNETFKPSLRELREASYTFAVLRCPYARLVSCFADKIVSRTREAWSFSDASGLEGPLARITFRKFCQAMARPEVRHANIHWRPQTDLLVYRDYDDLFALEDFAEAVGRLKRKIGLEVIDSRSFVQHDSSQYLTVFQSRNWADAEAWELEAMMLRGERPDPRGFYDNSLADITEAAFATDFALFRDRFAGLGLFDRQPARARLSLV